MTRAPASNTLLKRNTKSLQKNGLGVRTWPCTGFERFWRRRRLCEVERSGTKHSRRKQIGAAFQNRAARREQPT